MAKIMLVDDDLDINAQNKMVLEAKGHTVSVAASAKEAHELLKKSVPDAIVLDVIMENVRAGLNFARDIAKEHSVPIVLLTSDMNNPAWQANESETWNWIFKYLTKPVKPEELVKAIEEVIKEKSKTKAKK